MKKVMSYLPALLLLFLGLFVLPHDGRQLLESLPFLGDRDAELIVAHEPTEDANLLLALQQVMSNEQAFTIRKADQAARGTQDKLTALEKGQVDFARVRSGLGLAHNGTAVLADAGREYAHFIVPATSAMFSFRDLSGSRIGVGPAHGDTALFADQVLAYLNFDEPASLVDGNQTNLHQAFAANTIDAALLLEPLLGPQVDTLLSSGQYRLLPVPEAEAIAKALPGVYEEEIPGNLYGPDRTLPPLESGRFPALAVNSLLVARLEAPVERVAALLGQLLEMPREPARGLSYFSLPGTDEFRGWRFHPAVERLKQRTRPITRDDLQWLLQSLAGWGMIALALGLAVSSLRQHREYARRRELHEWFELVQDIGARMEVAEGPRELGRLVDDLASKQRLAERAYVTGKLDHEELMLFNAAHQVRLLDAVAKHGQSIESPVAPSNAPSSGMPAAPSIFASYAGALEPESEEEMERSPTVVRPDYGEALINTVRVRRREPAPAESSYTREERYEPSPTRRSTAEERPEERIEGMDGSEAGATHTASSLAEDVRAAELTHPAEEAEPRGSSRRRKRGGRGRHGRADREAAQTPHAAEEHQGPVQRTRPTKEQLDLFGRRS